MDEHEFCVCLPIDVGTELKHVNNFCSPQLLSEIIWHEFFEILSHLYSGKSLSKQTAASYAGASISSNTTALIF